MDGLRFQQVEAEHQKAVAGTLIREYLEWLNERLRRDYSLEFDVEAMVRSDLTDREKFHPPSGRFYLALLDDQPVGVGCLKRLQSDVGELQRMYVPPAHRGRGLGRAIADRLIEDARSIGYRKLRLESLEFLTAAHSLYRSLGFHDIRPYTHNSMESFQAGEQLDRYYAITVFMEMDLLP